MKKIITLCLFTLSISINAFSTARVSAGNGDWNTATTWTPNGIPALGDDLTIQLGHTITISATAKCKNLLVTNGTIQWLANVFLQCTGSYTLSAAGIEKGTGQINFAGVSGLPLTVTGTTVGTVRYYFSQNRTISASSVISKLTSTTQIVAAKTVTNLGTYTMGSALFAATSKWVNGAGSNLILTVNGFTSALGLFDPSAAGNTVTLNYTAGNVPKPMAGSSYSNLVISGGSGTKALQQNLVCTKNLTINAGATLNSNSFDITVGGNWTKNGSFTAIANHFVKFNGSSAQTLSGSGTTRFEQLTMNNTGGGVSITSGIYLLNDVLTMTSGNFDVNGNSFTLLSTAARTARIAQVAGGAMLGNFTIERFITSRDTTWSDLSSPVQASTFVDWDNELPAISYTYNPPFQQPSAFAWSEPANNIIPVTASSTALTPGVGFEVYLSNDFVYSSIPNLTMNTIGVPNQGNQNLSSLISYSSAYPTGSSNLVGNPFASSIAWSTVLAASSNLDPTIDMFDYTAGAYTNYGAGTIIGSSQGFWVYTMNAGATLHINENAKTTATNSSLRTTEVEPYFTLKLSSADKTVSYYQTLKVGTSADATDGFDVGKDHMFRKSPLKATPGIYTAINGVNSVIDVFNSNDETYDMPLNTTVGVSGYYKIEAKGFDFLNDFTCVKLEDKLLGKFVDLDREAVYSFKMNSTDNENRFVIHFSKSGNCKSLVSNKTDVSLGNQVEVLPTTQGNLINFNFAQTTNTSISLTDLLGQTIVEVMNVDAFNQSVNVVLPEGFTGMYLVKIESANGTIIKKFVK